MTSSILYILIAVVAAAAAEVMLKNGMRRIGAVTLDLNELPGILWRLATSPFVVFGLCIYLFSMVFWLTALSRVDLTYAYPFVSVTYVLVLTASWLLFRERITRLRLLGTMVVGLGVFLISQS